jgi:hypothetical protein
MKQYPHNTVLFNVAAYTVLQLSVAEAKRVYSYIEEVMNGDGLYEGASKETILEAYHNQYNPYNAWTWAALIGECQTDMASEPLTSSWA